MTRLLSAALLLLTLASNAWAQGKKFAVNGTLEGNQTFSGFFVFDGLNQVILSSNITSSSQDGFEGRTYKSSGGAPLSVFTTYDDFTLRFFGSSGWLFFWLAGAPQDFVGGDIYVVGPSCPDDLCGASLEVDFDQSNRAVTGGTVTLVPVPEPASVTLLLTGLGALALAARGRRRV